MPGSLHRLPLSVGVALLVLLGVTRLRGAEGLSDIQKQQVLVHQTILNKLQAYSPEQQFKLVYGLVAKANERDLDRHRKYVEGLVAKAEEARGKGQGQAQDYITMAKAYKAIADLNHRIVQAFAANDRDKMDAAIAELDTVSGQIAKVTGKSVARDWFTPKESASFALGEMARQKKQGQ